MDADKLDELERLLKAAQTYGPWQVVRYGDDAMPALAIHWSEEDRICFMPTIRHPADEVLFEANAALIVAAINALEELVAMGRRVAELEGALQEIAYPQPTFAGPPCCGDTFADACELFGDIARTALKVPSQ
jgi:hypothetical protein